MDMIEKLTVLADDWDEAMDELATRFRMFGLDNPELDVPDDLANRLKRIWLVVRDWHQDVPCDCGSENHH